MEKGNIMATTKESMKVIAGGLDKREEPEVVMEGKVIAVEVPDELAELFEGFIGSLIGNSEEANKKETEKEHDTEKDYGNSDREPTEAQELVWDFASALGCRASKHLVMLKEKNDFSTEKMLKIVRGLIGLDSDYMVSILSGILILGDMEDAAHEIDLLDICKRYDDDAASIFTDAFWDTDAMDWYSIELSIRDSDDKRTNDNNNKLN